MTISKKTSAAPYLSRQISFQLGFETALVPIELASAVRERHIREWRVPRQRENAMKRRLWSVVDGIS